MKLLIGLLLAYGLSACASVTSKHSNAEKLITPSKTSQQQLVNLHEYSPRFLYLAAQTALQDHHNNLAMQFLEALNKKLEKATHNEQQWSIEPRLQLAQLWLQHRKISASKALLESLLPHHPLLKSAKEKVLQLHTLYARTLSAQHQYNDALDGLTRLLSLFPDFLPARHLQIALFMETKHWDLAHIAIQAAIQRHDTAALRKLDADVFMYETKYVQALQSLKKMQALVPDSNEVPRLQSDIAIKQGNQQQASRYLKDFLRGHPHDIVVKNKLASLYIRMQQTDDAIRLYEEMAETMPHRTEIFSTLGVLFYQQKKLQEAVKYFKRAYKLSPTGRGNAFYLAASLASLEKTQRAYTLYQKVPKSDDLWLEAQLRLAGLDFIDKKFHAVQQQLLPLLKDHPQANHGWVLLSSSYLNQKKYQALLQHTQAGALQQPPSPRLMLNRAIALEHFKRYSDVESTLKQVLKDHPKDSEALNFLGYTYAEQGIQLSEAESYIQRALRLKPNDGYYLDSLAWVYYQQQKYQKAIEVQRQSLLLITDDATMQEHLGDMLWQAGEHDAAIKQWQFTLTFKPEKPELIQYKIKHGL